MKVFKLAVLLALFVPSTLRAEPSFAPNRFIVKLKNSPVPGARRSTLDALNTKFKVKSTRLLFQLDNEAHTFSKAADGSALKRKLDAIKARFSDRATRIPRALTKAALQDKLADTWVLELGSGSDLTGAMLEYKKDPNVEFVQLDFRVKTVSVPNDPVYPQQWDLAKMHFGEVWDTNRGDGIIVAVVDSGVDYLHPDIAQNIWVNPCEDLDHDGVVEPSDFDNADTACAGHAINGVVDDLRGWNFVEHNSNVMDNFGHGTHVAGTIAAVGDNGLGIIGVASRAKIMPVRALDDYGSGYVSDLADAIVYAASNGADVINNSWGCYGPCPSNPVIENAVATAFGLGAAVVFAAGNDNAPVLLYSPQNMNDVITVAASDENDARAGFSNYGYRVDIAAPGTNIISLNAKGGNNTAAQYGLCTPIDSNYMSCSGTSMAAPHVAGLVALLLKDRPNLPLEQIRQALRSSADDDAASPGFDQYMGAGRVNAAAALGSFPLEARLFGQGSSLVPLNSATPLAIAGVVGNAYTFYTLSYADVSHSTGTPVPNLAWHPIIGSPSGGGLATWDTSSLAAGYYLLRLQAHDAGQEVFEDYALAVKESSGVKKIANVVAPGQYIAAFPPVNYFVLKSHYAAWIDAGDVYLYDFSTSQLKTVRNFNHIAGGLAIVGDRLIWADDIDGAIPNSFQYFMSTGQTYALTSVHAYEMLRSSDTYLLTDNGSNGMTAFDFISNPRPIDPSLGSLGDVSGNLVVGGQLGILGLNLWWEDLSSSAVGGVSSTGFPADCARIIYPFVSGRNIIFENTQSGMLCRYNIDTAQAVTVGRLAPANPGSNGPFYGTYQKAISNDRVAWIDASESIPALKTHSIATGTVQDIYTRGVRKNWIDASDTTVGWIDNTGVYVYKNLPPDLQSIADRTITETNPLSVSVLSTGDPENEAVTLTAQLSNGNPLSSIGASFTDNGGGHGVFNWTPSLGQGRKDYTIEFSAADPEGAQTHRQMTVHVLPLYNGPDWYVSNSGSDTTGQGSVGAPFATLQKAIDTASIGGSIHLAAGTYSAANINKNGITVSGIHSDPTLVTVQGIIANTPAIRAIGVSGITVKDLTVTAGSAGVGFNTVTDGTITNVRAVANRVGIGLSSSRTVNIQNCVVSSSTLLGGLLIQTTDDLVVDGNTFVSNPVTAITFTNPADGTILSHNARITNNLFQSNQRGVNLKAPNVSLFANNRFVGTVISNVNNIDPSQLDARFNYWGSMNPSVIAPTILGNVLWVPFNNDQGVCQPSANSCNAPEPTQCGVNTFGTDDCGATCTRQAPACACQGSLASHAVLCSGDDQNLTQNTPYTLVAACGSPKCEAVCDSGYLLQGGVCAPAASPDLTFTQFFAESPAQGDLNGALFTANDGEAFYLTVTFQNSGNAAAGPNVLRYFDADTNQEYVGQRQNISLSLAPGDTQTFTSPERWVAMPGIHHIRVQIDGDGQIAESNESNNAATITIVVAETPEEGGGGY